MDTLQVRPNDTNDIVLRAMKAERPIFIWGAPGIGKSELVQQIVDSGELGNAHMIDLRLALMEPTDLRGYPFRNPENNLMEWAPPADLPTQEMADAHDTIVLFLDELNSAPPSVQAAAYQLVLNKRIGQYNLPTNVKIVAAGNRETDRGVTYRMPSPLANRFRHINMEVNFEDWSIWATNNKVHQDVIGYLTYSKADLFDFDPKTSSQAFATPRSWNYVSEILNTEGFDNATDFQQKAEVAGAIGEGMAIKFCEHRKIASKLPNPEDVLNGKVKKLDIKEKSAQYSFAIGLCYELADLSENGSEDAFDEGVDYFFEFIMQNFEPELVIYSAKTVLADHDIDIKPRKLAGKKEFKEKYWKYLFPTE
tara:strand:+ start:265 stop:1359 length:1095 start_codon:yes stop_codon:yes gene_type:complete